MLEATVIILWLCTCTLAVHRQYAVSTRWIRHTLRESGRVTFDWANTGLHVELVYEAGAVITIRTSAGPVLF